MRVRNLGCSWPNSSALWIYLCVLGVCWRWTYLGWCPLGQSALLQNHVSRVRNTEVPLQASPCLTVANTPLVVTDCMYESTSMSESRSDMTPCPQREGECCKVTRHREPMGEKVRTGGCSRNPHVTGSYRTRWGELLWELVKLHLWGT